MSERHDVTKGFQIRFAGEGPDLEFVEVENLYGASVRIGRWVDDGEYKLLVVDPVGEVRS